MTSFDYFDGWEYISALFNFFQEKSQSATMDSHIAPRYIFRGISKRFFTESSNISKLLAELKIKIGKESDKNNSYISSNEIINLISTRKETKYPLLTSENRKTSFNVKDLKESDLYEVLYKDLKHHVAKRTFKKHHTTTNEHLAILYNITEDPFFDYIKPEQIRSGTSVRLRDTESNYTAIADYLSYTKNLSEGFKRVNPSLRSLDELEILAEIQHRGGGSCLVDFSNNFLISLWFAVNGNPEDLGYLFCYDVNCDAFQNGNLSYLNKFNWDKDIEKLLRRTQTTATYLDDNKNKFWLWKPANINGRIARQDSVFIFGIEKFFIEQHEVIVIPVPQMWKSSILKCLKVYFGITSESVFPDIDGYATAHSKISPLYDTTLYLNPRWNVPPTKRRGEIFKLNLVQKGMSCLLKGDYSISLDYFNRALNTAEIDYNVIDSIRDAKCKIPQQKIYFEIYYSIGLCYRKLNQDLMAESFLREAFFISLSILTGEELKACESYVVNENQLKSLLGKNKWQKAKIAKLPYLDRERVRFVNKFYKIVDEYMDTLYNVKHYGLAFPLVNFLKRISMGDNSGVILNTVHNCLKLLEHLNKLTESEQLSDITFCKFSDIDFSGCKLYERINRIIDLIYSIMKVYSKSTERGGILMDNDIKIQISNFDKSLDDSAVQDTNPNTNWIFDDLTEGVRIYFKDSPLITNCLVSRINQLQQMQDAIQCNRIV